MGQRDIYDFLRRNKKKYYTQRQIRNYVDTTVTHKQLNALVRRKVLVCKVRMVKVGNRKSKNPIKHFKVK